MTIFKRIASLLFVLLLPLAAGCADAYRPLPELLAFTQTTESDQLRADCHVVKTLVQTKNAAVDAEIAALVEGMLSEELPGFEARPFSRAAWLDAGPIVSWTGERWMSFLVLCEESRDREPFGLRMQTRTYDMETGERVALTDLFAPESEAWALLSDAIREQLSDAFPRMEPDAAALDALTEREALEQADFTLGPVRLTLHVRADALYPGRQTLLHVSLPYRLLRPHMTEKALAQTDNSGYKMVALTYDDGGSRTTTRGLLNQLRLYGAQATFFLVGREMRSNFDHLALEQNRGYSLASHTFSHKYFYDMSFDQYQKDAAAFAYELSDYVGVTPTLLRAPGGSEAYYAGRDIGYPVIHWSLASGDAGGSARKDVARRVIRNIAPFDVVLLHETNKEVGAYSQDILEYLRDEQYICVTVEDLFEAAGVPLLKNGVYFSPYSPRNNLENAR